MPLYDGIRVHPGWRQPQMPLTRPDGEFGIAGDAAEPRGERGEPPALLPSRGQGDAKAEGTSPPQPPGTRTGGARATNVAMVEEAELEILSFYPKNTLWDCLQVPPVPGWFGVTGVTQRHGAQSHPMSLSLLCC